MCAGDCRCLDDTNGQADDTWSIAAGVSTRLHGVLIISKSDKVSPLTVT